MSLMKSRSKSVDEENEKVCGSTANFSQKFAQDIVKAEVAGAVR